MLDSSFFMRNREKIQASMNNSSIYVLFQKDKIIKGDGEYFDFPDSNFFYLTGIQQSNSKLVMFKSDKGLVEDFLFLSKPDPNLEMWEGKKLSVEEASKISGIKNILYLEDFESEINSLIQKINHLYYIQGKNFNGTISSYENYIQSLKNNFSELKFSNLNLEISRLRQIKSKEEIDLIRKSISITYTAFKSLLSKLKSLSSEFEVEAELTHCYISNLSKHSYHPIIASGKNSCTLHYIENKSEFNSNILLIDTGAEFSNYKSDISRTFPVSGKFSQREKEIYVSCLNVQEYAISRLKPGKKLKEWELDVRMKMGEELFKLNLISEENTHNLEEIKKYYPHSTGHFLGLDTHDCGDYTIPLKEGMILTVEPGIYVRDENIGVRIEDNILITSSGFEILSNKIPKTVDEIEHLIN